MILYSLASELILKVKEEGCGHIFVGTTLIPSVSVPWWIMFTLGAKLTPIKSDDQIIE